MQRAAILIILIMIILMMMAAGLACTVPCMASETRPATALNSPVRVLGVERQMLDTYAIDVSLASGVHLRDVYSVFRGGEKIADGVVVEVGPRYSLITLRQQDVTLRRGDMARRAGRSAVVRRLAWKPSPEVIVVTDRNARTMGSALVVPSISTSFSGPTTFSGSTSFNNSTSFSGSTLFSGSTSFSGSTVSSVSTTFDGGTALSDSMQYNGSTTYSGGTTLNLPTSMTIPSF